MTPLTTLTLSEAQGHWAFGENNDCWTVTDNQGNKIWTFPKGFNEEMLMSAIRLGREFELAAFNIGIDFGKSAQSRIGDIEKRRMASEIASLTIMNGTLSEQLQQQISGV